MSEAKRICVGLISPGDMGHAIGKVMVEHGVDVITCLNGRSNRTKELAKLASIRDVGDDVTFVKESNIILSVLIPSNAHEVVDRMIEAVKIIHQQNPQQTIPLFVELNPIAPETVKVFSEKLKQSNIELVDGCVIGLPPKPTAAHKTKLYVSGPRAKEVEVLRDFGLNIRYIGEDIGKASGLKMAYASFIKGVTALGTQAMVAAEAMGLSAELTQELQESQPLLLEKLNSAVPDMCPKAYRWHGELEEMASTYKNLGMTSKVYEGIADVFRFVESTPLGKEVIEDRKIGKTIGEAVSIMAQHLNKDAK